MLRNFFICFVFDFIKHNNFFKFGFQFVYCGSTKSKYLVSVCTIEHIDGHLTEYADSCIITDNIKRLSYDSINNFEESEVLEYGDAYQ